MTARQIAESLPRDYRIKVIEWLQVAKAAKPNKEFWLLWEAYYIFVDPGGVKQDECPVCRGNVLDNWRTLSKEIAEVEKQYNLLDQI